MEDDEDIAPAPDGEGRLMLSSLGIGTLHRNVFSHAKRILVLDLSNNALEAIPREIGKLTLLRDLSVARNQLRALPPQIGRCRSLQRIDASNNRLESLPPKLGQCRDLRELDVHRNNLTALPAALGRLPLLSRLLFERNAVEHFPPELAHCERLEEINCFDNPIRNLPAQCLTDVGMIRWLAEHDYSWQERVKALEESSAELEDAARQSSEQRMLLQERVEMLEGELRLLEESTERYRTVRRACATWCPECSGCTIV